MPIFVWVAAAALAASAPIGWWAVAGDRQVARRVNRNLVTYNLTMREAVLDRSASERFVAPLARALGDRLLRFTPVGWSRAQGGQLARAGLTGRITPEQVLGAKVIAPLLTGAVLALRVVSAPTPANMLAALASTVMAFFLPDLLVRTKADRRADEIVRSLPDVLDQLTISVEAGLGFEAALARIVQTDEGPLAQELGRMLQDIQLGTRRVDALDALARRCGVNDLRSVVLALRQAEALGAPLAGTLRTLALEMREKRRFRAEERAHQLPVKMIFPLGLCIMPALMIVILGPAIIGYLRLF
ncbi:MAG: type II secretion system F family protein [Acidimicrobiia bacterium]|nr:type II secretion system F family protein [Acidimicrobiia bacterium]MDH5289767.1 type II secretion system F family protein [Acidimicrobiia bacterium]